MDATTWQNLGLLFHIVGIVLLSGGTVGGYLVDRAIWANIKTAPLQAAAVGRLSRAFSLTPQIGSGLMLLSGLLLLASKNWAYWGQIWLTVKLVLFVLLSLNGALVAGPAGKQLGQLMPRWLAVTGAIPAMAGAGVGSRIVADGPASAPGNREEIEAGLASVQARFNYFHISETLMFLVVIILGVFKFS